MLQVIWGLIASLLIILLTILLSRYLTGKLIATTLLVAIGFLYVGFALGSKEPHWIFVESAVALGFYFLAIIGYTEKTTLIAYGILLHGLWDALHHAGSSIQTSIPTYWPSFCFVVDLVVGGFFLLLFKRKSVANRSIPSKGGAAL